MNRFFSIILLSLVCIFVLVPLKTSAFTISKTNINALGLVGYWTFDGSDMLTGVVLDRSGNGNTGSLVNIATSTSRTVGKIGQALRFDGTLGADNYVTTSLSESDDWSMSLWVKVDTTAKIIQYPVGFRTDTQAGLFVEYSSASDNWGIYDGTTVLVSGINLAEREWYYLSVVKTGTTYNLYTNGVLSKTGSLVDINLGSLRLGRNSASTNHFDGTLDDVRIYNRALSATEIGALYGSNISRRNISQGVVTNGLVGHWTFDGKDMPNGSVSDVSGNGNMGSMVNMATSTAFKPGKIGQALQFDGVDDQISVPHSSSLNPSEITISFWINQLGVVSSNNGSFINKNSTTGYRIRPSGAGGLQFLFNGGIQASFSNLNLNTWNHVVVVGNSSGTRFYVNNVAGSLDADPYVASASSGDFKIAGGLLNQLYMDDVRVYNRALSVDEVNVLYQGNSLKGNVSRKVIENNLVGYWTFDGKDMPNGSVNDVSGNGNVGRMINMATSTAYRPGKIGQALNFDGVNDYVTTGHTITEITGSTDLTISGWFRLNDLITSRWLLKQGDAGVSTGISLMYYSNPVGSLAFNVGTFANRLQVPNFFTNTTEFVHLAAVKSGTTLLVYRNGILVGSGDRTISNEPTTHFFIGGPAGGGPSAWLGGIDDVRLYNRALSAAEVKALYSTGR